MEACLGGGRDWPTKESFQSGRAEIRLVQVDRWIQMEFPDWGVRSDPDGLEEQGLGLPGIRERARLLRVVER